MKSIVLFLSLMFTIAFAAPVSASGLTVLPTAISYESIGFNYAIYGETSDQVGTLDYTGHPGCASTCTLTTQLGASPSISASFSVQYIDIYQTCCGGADVKLGYYVEYLNSPGTYNVDLHAIDQLSSPTAVSASLRFGRAGNSHNFNDFSSVTFEEADCLNGCPAPGFVISPAPFVADHQVQMEANTPYYIELELRLNGALGGQITGLIDPTFSSISGGQFIFSSGVTSAVPEPSSWAMMVIGFAGLGFAGLKHTRRRAIAA